MSIRRKIRGFSWVLGCLTTATSIGQYGYVSHASQIKEEYIVKMQKGAQIIMFNGVGLCLISRKKKTFMIAIPMAALSLSIAIMLATVGYMRAKSL